VSQPVARFSMVRVQCTEEVRGKSQKPDVQIALWAGGVRCAVYCRWILPGPCAGSIGIHSPTGAARCRWIILLLLADRRRDRLAGARRHGEIARRLPDWRTACWRSPPREARRHIESACRYGEPVGGCCCSVSRGRERQPLDSARGPDPFDSARGPEHACGELVEPVERASGSARGSGSLLSRWPSSP